MTSMINVVDSINSTNIQSKDIEGLYNICKKKVKTNPLSLYEYYNAKDSVKIHFDIDLGVDMKENVLTVKDVAEEVEEYLDNMFNEEIEWSVCYDDKIYKKTKDKTFSRKFSVHLVGNKTMNNQKLKWLIQQYTEEYPPTYELDISVYRTGFNKFRIPLTNKDKCLEERKNSGYMNMDKNKLSYFKKLLITYTDDVEEYKNETLDIAYEKSKTEKKENKKPTSIKLEINSDDILDIIEEYDYISKKEGDGEYDGYDLYLLKEYFCPHGEHGSNHNYLVHNRDNNTLKLKCFSDKRECCKTFEKMIYDGSKKKYETYVNNKLIEYKQKYPKENINSFNFNFFKYLTTKDKNDYVIKREYFKRFIIFFSFNNQVLERKFNYITRKPEWEIVEGNKLNFLNLYTYEFEGEENKKVKFFQKFKGDEDIQTYNNYTYYPTGINEEKENINDYNTFDGFGFENTQNNYIKSYADMLLFNVECSWKTRKEWSENKPETELDNLIKHLTPVENFFRDLVECNLSNEIMYNFKQKTKDNTLTLNKKELFENFKDYYKQQNNNEHKNYAFTTFEKNVENLLFKVLENENRTNWNINIKTLIEKLTNLKITTDIVLKDFLQTLSGYEYQNYQYSKTYEKEIKKEKQQNNLKCKNEKVRFMEYLEQLTKDLPYDTEVIDMLKNYLEYQFIYLFSSQIEIMDYYLKWLKFILTNPRDKNGKCIVFFSKEKCVGKGETSNMLMKLIGMNNSFMGDIKKLFGTFSNSSDATILSVYDEINGNSFSNENYNTFKNVVTEVYGEVEKKHVNIKKAANFNKVILLTNEINSIRVDSEEDRFFILHFRKEYNNTVWKKYEKSYAAFQ